MYTRKCHYCEYCTDTHPTDNFNQSNAFCSYYKEKVIEYGMVCENWKEIKNPESRDKIA